MAVSKWLIANVYAGLFFIVFKHLWVLRKNDSKTKAKFIDV